MGQIASTQTHRRLAWADKRGSYFDFKRGKSGGLEANIFGKWDYGYPEDYQVISSWTIWALVTWGSFSIDPWEAAAILAGSFYAQENRDVLTMLLFEDQEWSSGSSWVHNIQAGYCWYHYFLKGNNSWPVFLGSWAEIAGDLGAVAEEYSQDRGLYAHDAHYKGATLGMAVAYLLDIARKKRRKTGSSKYYLVPFAAIGALIMADMSKRKAEA